MFQDIDDALRGWPFRAGGVQARLVQARDGRQVIQLRVDLGLLQLESIGRPDGTKPHDCPTYLDYLRGQAALAAKNNERFVLSQEQCDEADREFVQYYHRRISWLTLHHFKRAIADADHTLEFMDFVRDHSPCPEYTEAHEQYRGFVLFHRTQAGAAQAIETNDPEAALDVVKTGLDQIREVFVGSGAEDEFEENGMVEQLRRMDRAIRQQHNIEATLQEQLDLAIANEDYEVAARLRDRIRERRT